MKSSDPLKKQAEQLFDESIDVINMIQTKGDESGYSRYLSIMSESLFFISSLLCDCRRLLFIITSALFTYILLNAF